MENINFFKNSIDNWPDGWYAWVHLKLDASHFRWQSYDAAHVVVAAAGAGPPSGLAGPLIIPWLHRVSSLPKEKIYQLMMQPNSLLPICAAGKQGKDSMCVDFNGKLKHPTQISVQHSLCNNDEMQLDFCLHDDHQFVYPQFLSQFSTNQTSTCVFIYLSFFLAG